MDAPTHSGDSGTTLILEDATQDAISLLSDWITRISPLPIGIGDTCLVGTVAADTCSRCRYPTGTRGQQQQGGDSETVAGERMQGSGSRAVAERRQNGGAERRGKASADGSGNDSTTQRCEVERCSAEQVEAPSRQPSPGPVAPPGADGIIAITPQKIPANSDVVPVASSPEDAARKAGELPCSLLSLEYSYRARLRARVAFSTGFPQVSLSFPQVFHRFSTGQLDPEERRILYENLWDLYDSEES